MEECRDKNLGAICLWGRVLSGANKWQTSAQIVKACPVWGEALQVAASFWMPSMHFSDFGHQNNETYWNCMPLLYLRRQQCLLTECKNKICVVGFLINSNTVVEQPQPVLMYFCWMNFDSKLTSFLISKFYTEILVFRWHYFQRAFDFLRVDFMMFTWLNCVYRSSQRSPSPGPNHVSSSVNSAPSAASAPSTTSAARISCSLTPSFSSHFNENLIRHVQGWPAEHIEKQVCPTTFIRFFFMILLSSNVCNVQITQASRLREEAHTMGSICLSENCTELKNLRSLVRVCEIQATLREQRWAHANMHIWACTEISIAFVSSAGYYFWDSK